MVVFITSKYLIQKQCSKLFEKNKLFQATNRAMANGATGLKVAALLRPVGPYGLLSYILGVTPMKF